MTDPARIAELVRVLRSILERLRTVHADDHDSNLSLLLDIEGEIEAALNDGTDNG